MNLSSQELLSLLLYQDHLGNHFLQVHQEILLLQELRLIQVNRPVLCFLDFQLGQVIQGSQLLQYHLEFQDFRDFHLIQGALEGLCLLEYRGYLGTRLVLLHLRFPGSLLDQLHLQSLGNQEFHLIQDYQEIR